MNAAEFLKHFPETATAEREIVTQAFAISDTIREKAIEIREDRRLSDFGRSERLSELLKGGMGEHFAQLKAKAEALHADIASRKAAVVRPAAVLKDGEAKEMRDFLRSLPIGERLRVAMSSPEMREAVLSSPAPALTGLTSDMIERLQEITFEPMRLQFATEQRHAAVVADAITFVSHLLEKETGVVHDNTPEIITRTISRDGSKRSNGRDEGG